MNEKQPNRTKKGITFHRTFRLKRAAITQLLEVALEYKLAGDNECPSPKNFREKTQLGTIYIEAMPRYAQITGLLDDDNCLTPFGEVVAQNDMLQERKETQWLMHYHMCSPSSSSPDFWRETVLSYFLSGNAFTRETIEDFLSSFVEKTEGRSLSTRDAKTTARIFLDTYIDREDSLGSLGILEEINKNEYVVQSPEPPPLWAFAYALIDYWKTTYGEDRLTVNLDELTARGGLGSIFLMGGGRMNSYLQRLQRKGVVDIFIVSPPYQVVLQETDEQTILEQLYDEDDYF